MTQLTGIKKAEIEQLLRLVGRLQEQPAASDQRAREALTGVTELVGGRAAMFASFRRPEISKLRQALRVGRYVSLSGPPERVLRESLCQAAAYCPAWERFLDRCGELDEKATLALPRSALVPDAEWYALDVVRRYYTPCGADRFLCAVRRLERLDCYAVLLIYRPWEAGGFKRREQELAELFWSTAGWLLHDGQGGSDAAHEPVRELEATLPPRLQQVLGRLLKGYQADLIAEELGLSVHTVYEHMKRLYERAGVPDRRGLISKLQVASSHDGNGGRNTIGNGKRASRSS